MWTKPWTFKEGFLIGGGLIFAGLALELSVGPVNWDSFAWPANGIVLGFLLAFDYRLEFHAAQLADDELRCECIAMSSWITPTQLLRSQILHSLPHVVLPLGLHLQTQGNSEGQKPYFLIHES